MYYLFMVSYVFLFTHFMTISGKFDPIENGNKTIPLYLVQVVIITMLALFSFKILLEGKIISNTIQFATILFAIGIIVSDTYIYFKYIRGLSYKEIADRDVLKYRFFGVHVPLMIFFMIIVTTLAFNFLGFYL